MNEDECSLRTMHCELSNLSEPDGSSMLIQGDTAVIAGVYGPTDVKIQKMMHDRASVEASYASGKGPQSINDRLMELYIKDTCEAALISTLHPGCAISINVKEMQDFGGLLACVINASCMALINSSLSMKFTVAAVSCMIEKDSGKVILDPNSEQTKNARATFTYAFDSITRDVISCHSTGRFSEKEYTVTVERCRDASQHVFDFYRDIVRQYANII